MQAPSEDAGETIWAAASIINIIGAPLSVSALG
jgi:hypothetical protein